VEVYDHSQPTSWIEIAAIKPFAARRWVLLAVVGNVDGVKNRGGVFDHLRSAAPQVGYGAPVEDDEATVRVEGACFWE
jgi:hypothetical protein